MTTYPFPFYSQSLALLTDFYQLTMAQGYWKEGIHKRESVFHLFFRRTPFQGGFTIVAGLEPVIHFLQNFHFSSSDISYLASLKGIEGDPIFCVDFLDYLSTLRFTGHLDAIPEGHVVFPYEPLLRVQGPLIECQLLESILLNIINFSTLIATKAARIRLAAQEDTVLEFGMRRAQGMDGALTASRSAFIGGCDATSNVLAGKLFGIPVKGTHSHSWVMVFDDELESFQAYAKQMPNDSVFLVDTYNTIEGVKKAIEVGHWLKKQGHQMMGIRLDSGDLAELSIKSRELLDQAGFDRAVIVASNELDETLISELKRQKAQISVWGVGTNLVTAKDQPALDGVYKLSALKNEKGEWKYKLKLSEQMIKVSNPGILQVRRFQKQGVNIADAIYDIYLSIERDCQIINPLDPTHARSISKEIKYKDLLEPIFREGKCIYSLPSLVEIKRHSQKELSNFQIGIKRYLNPHLYFVGMEHSLYELKIDLMQQVRHSSSTFHL